MSKKIIIAAEDSMGLNGQVSAHFGRCPYYILVEVENDEIKKVSNVENPYYVSHGEPGLAPNFIKQQEAEVIIAGGMGPRAIEFFNQLGIEAVTGVSGRVADAINSYLKGNLQGSGPCR